MENVGSYKHFGPFFKALRKERKITLRQFCKTALADPGNISKMERSIWAPPQDNEILGRYASALGVKEGTDEWYQFCDLASADCGIVPRDLMSDEKVVEMLPVFFRTLRGRKPTETEMRKVAEKIRRS